MTAPHPELSRLVDVWWQSVEEFTQFVETLPPEAWSTPTDLPGWDVHAVVAHVAHLEALAAGRAHDDVEIGDVPHVRNPLGTITEQGVVARRGHDTDALVNEIRESATARHTATLADPPTDPDAPAPAPFGALGWSVRTLLRNRPLDVHLHEQDVRRAVGQPGNTDSAAAVHAADYLSDSMGFVLAKRVKAPTGTTLRLEVAGHAPRAWQIGDDGRGKELDSLPDSTDVTLACDRETFLLLAGGRQPTPEVRERVRVEGDTELGARVVENLAVTP